MKNEYSRGQLAKKTGCNSETIRYYEKETLLPEPRRSENGYRLYDGKDIKRLSFICRCRNLGFTINEIRELLNLVDNSYTCSDISSITEIHIQDVQSKITDLKNILKTLLRMSRACNTDDSLDCPIIEELFNKKKKKQ